MAKSIALLLVLVFATCTQAEQVDELEALVRDGEELLASLPSSADKEVEIIPEEQLTQEEEVVDESEVDAQYNSIFKDAQKDVDKEDAEEAASYGSRPERTNQEREIEEAAKKQREQQKEEEAKQQKEHAQEKKVQTEKDTVRAFKNLEGMVGKKAYKRLMAGKSGFGDIGSAPKVHKIPPKPPTKEELKAKKKEELEKGLALFRKLTGTEPKKQPDPLADVKAKIKDEPQTHYDPLEGSFGNAVNNALAPPTPRPPKKETPPTAMQTAHSPRQGKPGNEALEVEHTAHQQHKAPPKPHIDMMERQREDEAAAERDEAMEKVQQADAREHKAVAESMPASHEMSQPEEDDMEDHLEGQPLKMPAQQPQPSELPGIKVKVLPRREVNQPTGKGKRMLPPSVHLPSVDEEAVVRDQQSKIFEAQRKREQAAQAAAELADKKRKEAAAEAEEKRFNALTAKEQRAEFHKAAINNPVFKDAKQNGDFEEKKNDEDLEDDFGMNEHNGVYHLFKSIGMEDQMKTQYHPYAGLGDI